MDDRRPVNDSELIEYIKRMCEDEIERVEYYEEDAREMNWKMDERVVGRKEGYELILNTIEQREYIITKKD